jgi:hypothetical protein
MESRLKLSQISKVVACGVLLACATSVAAQKLDKAATISALKVTQADWHKAYVVSDSIKLMKMLSPGLKIIRTTGLILKKPEALSFYRTRDTSGLLVVTREQEVSVNGDLAVLTCIVEERDKGIRYVYYVTDVMERKASVWQVLHSQWSLLPGEWDKVHVDPALLNSYAGTYQSTAERTFIIEAQTDRLTLLTSRGNTFSFVPRSNTQFFIPGEPDELLFIKADGEQSPSFLVFITRINTTVFQRKK